MWPIDMLATSSMAASAMPLAVSFSRALLRESSSSTTSTHAGAMETTDTELR